MRLTQDEAAGICAAAAEVFGPAATVRLFGSRTDDAKKGGDIDLMVEVPEGRDTFRDECAFARALEDRIGERRVDVLLVPPGREPAAIEAIARRDGLMLHSPSAGGAAGAPAQTGKVYGWDWSFDMTPDQVKLLDTVAAGRRLAERLRRSMADMAAIARLTPETVDALDWSAEKDVLAFLKSFEQLQDLTSNRLIRGVLIVAEVDVVGISARDAYDKAEKAGALADAARFVDIGRLRHRLVHEYPMDAAARARRINDALALAPALIEEFDRLAAYAARLAPEGETP